MGAFSEEYPRHPIELRSIGSEFSVEVRDEDNELVARVKKTIYIKKKQIAPAAITEQLESAPFAAG